MSKAWFIMGLALMALGGSLYWLLAAEKKSTASLRLEVAALRAQASASEATNAALRELSRAHIDRLNAGLTNTIRQLVTAQERIRQLELRPPPAAPLPETNAPADSVAEAVALPHPVTVTTNTVGLPQRQVLLSGLYTPKGGSLGTNLEFSGVYGRRLAFRDPLSGRRMAYDVDQIHPAVLAALGVDAEAQKLAQARQELAWKRMETASLAQAAAEAERRRERAAALAQARADAQQVPPADGVAPNLPPDQFGPGGFGPGPNQPWQEPAPQPGLPPW